MRTDAVGFFWEDVSTKAGRNTYARPMPEIPDTGWRPPREFPNLSAAKALAIDCETYDPNLLKKGPGWARGDGHIVGLAIGTEDGHRWYFPMRHETEVEDNLDPDRVLSWARGQLCRPHQPKIGANLPYDVGWLAHEGVPVNGQLIDVQMAEALLDESSPVNLEHLGQKYLGAGKETSFLYQWLADWFGGKPQQEQRAHIFKAPPRLVGPYAEGDVDLPFRIAELQYPLLGREGLGDLFRMECGLIPLLNAMRFRGVQVNISEAERVRDELLRRCDTLKKSIKNLVGFEVNTNAGASLAEAFDKLGLDYGRTAKGAPSFTKDFLATVEHPMAALVLEIKSLEKVRSTFVESYILDSHVNGRIHGQFHLLRSDTGGTRSGRFSSSTPNLQNIPSRDPELGPMIRGMFVPDYGHRRWRKYDYSQIEYRNLAHYAIGAGSEELRRVYCEDPDTDYHVITQNLVQAYTGRKIDRKPIKNINFGLIYGMGVDKLSRSLGLTPQGGRELFDAYHQAAPFAKATMEFFSEQAKTVGEIRTILGRKSRFDRWEPAEYDLRRQEPAMSYERALWKYGQIQRAYTHKALNRVLQGSAADLIKMAMFKCWNDGIFSRTGVPLLTVHDELDFSDPGTQESDEAFVEMRHILETAIPLRVPVKADYEVGPDWGHVAEAG